MALPIQTSAEDVQIVVDYLKTKPTGVTVAEAKTILGKHLDARKINGYTVWQFLKKDGDKLKLDEFGRQLSRTTDEGKRALYANVLKNIKPYHSCLEWAFHKKYETLTNAEVASFWHEHLTKEVGIENETTLKDAAVCFFNVVEAAGLGKLFMGRHGGTTRFEFNITAVGQYVGEAALTHTDIAEENKDEKIEEVPQDQSDNQINQHTDEKKIEDNVHNKVFISHSANIEIVDQIKTMLDLAGLEYEVAEDKEATAIPVSEKVFSAMRSSTSAIICVTADEKLKNVDESYTINQNVLIEIGAAFVLYDKK